MDQHRRQGRRYAVIRAEPGNDRDRFAKKIGLSESATALRRLFEDDGRDADAPWRISQAASLGAPDDRCSQRSPPVADRPRSAVGGRVRGELAVELAEQRDAVGQPQLGARRCQGEARARKAAEYQ
jgi:hypothetical protein